ncbi:hypothetical protein Chor_016405 [Crotalus horridus]
MPPGKTATLGKNVTLQCKISDYPPPELDIKKTIFIWYLETSEGNKIEELCSVIAGEHSSNRAGSRLDTIQLKNGNAALFLPQIQLNEEGKYTCVVIVASLRAEGATILDLVGPPSMKMVGSEELKHLEETSLQCLISHFRPKLLHADLFLVTEPQNTKQKIASWHTTSVEEPMEDDENVLLLRNLEDMFKVYPELKSKPGNYFDFQWKICINPDIQKLKKFELLLEVKHKGFQHGLGTERKSFKVIALPMLHEVHCSTNVPRSNEPLILSCKIHSYFPGTLEVCWSNDDGILDSSFSTPPTKGADGLYFCISKVQYCPQVADSGKRFVCRAKLQGSRVYKESTWQMNTVVLAPKVYKIECKPPIPECGKPTTLSCLLTKYHPPECDIYWRKGFEELTDATVKTEEPQLDRTSKLYSRTSEITFIPSAEDHEVDFFIEINHCNKILQERHTVMLQDFPKLSNIVIEPSNADYGATVNLICDITDFNPKEICAQWFLGDKSVTNDAVTENLDMASNSCYKLSSVLELKATASVCDKAICFKVSHARLTKPITREVYLKLPAKQPVLSEIKATPDHQNILLAISISQFAPHDIQVRWYQGWRQISENINPRNVEIGEDHLCYFVSKIHLDPKALVFGKTIRCEVKHPTSTEEKSLTLNTTGKLDAYINTLFIERVSRSVTIFQQLNGQLFLNCCNGSKILTH